MKPPPPPNRLGRLALGAVVPLLLVAAWSWRASWPGEVVIPSPGAVWEVALHPGAEPATIDAPPLGFSALTSLARVGLGFALAVVLAIPLGLLMGRSARIRALLSPSVTMVRVICPLAWLPLMIVLLGNASLAELLYGPAESWRHELLSSIQPAMVIVLAWGAFFPILLATAGAAQATQRRWLEGARLLGATRWQRFRWILLPAALPQILNSLRVGLGITWMVIVAAELFPGTRSGLGYTIWVAHETVQYRYAFAAVLYIMGIGLLLNGVLQALERHIGHWQAGQR